MTPKNKVCLGYDHDAEQAAAFYCATFPNWNAIVGNGGTESQCGWCKDRWRLSWQITPRALLDAWTDPDPVALMRAFVAMMGMKKIDVAAILAARKG